MSNYVIATILSFVTACFTMASSWTKSPRRTYLYQVGQCLVYAAASYFYGVYPAIFMMLLNALRDFLVATEKYKPHYCLIFTVLALGLGILTNTSGGVGLLAVGATVQYCICSYLMKEDIAVKLNVALNLAIWFVYDFAIRDIFSGVVDFVSVILAIVTIWRILRNRKKGPSATD